MSTYLKEGEEQKEVLEAKDDEEKESEIDGEAEERVTQRAHEEWRWLWNEWGTNSSCWAHLSHSAMCKESNEDDTKETLQNKPNKQTKGTHESSVGVLVRVHMLQFLRPR